MIDKILVPLDGSQLGEEALKFAVSVAAAVNAQIDLLTVYESNEKEHERMHELYLQKIREEISSTLHNNSDAARVNTQINRGQPADEIVKYAEEKGVSLIIMVSHGHSGIMPWSAGSTATKVVQKSTIPVLLIRAGNIAGVTSVNPFSHILLPLDGSPFGESAIPLVLDLAAAFHSEVELLRVVELVEHVHTVGGIDHFMFSDEQNKRMENEVGGYLHEIARRFLNAGINVKSVIKTGDAAMEIIKVSESGNFDLVAMSSHGKSGITKWVLGSVSHKILQAGKKPLLLVRPLYKNVT
ncbi:MAG: universal stress protein [Dehalococcoidales bacterium]|nr:universal stress protein [Dehalococcoidales bacterium]